MGESESSNEVGNQDARVFALLYSELRALAQAELRGERAGHTLNATALVNEAYLKVVRTSDSKGGDYLPPERGRFFAMAAVAMRRILVDHARTRGRQKRGGEEIVLGSEGLAGAASAAGPVDAIFLDDALNRLADEHADAAKVVELRFFGGLDDRGIAEALDISDRTVRRHWTFAKAWLARDLGAQNAVD